jgi:Zn-dependent peptidase ImmA (M78 family)
MREIMAHELGHIVLHGEKLFETKGTQGTIVLSKDPQLEQEAIWFAEAILKLRWDRIQKLHRLGS